MVDLTRRKTLFTTGSVLASLATATTASAHGGSHSDGEIKAQDRHKVAEARRATAKYQDPEVAKDDGYQPVHGCVTNPNGEGAMGVHFINPSLIGDGEVNVTEPEVLLYEPTENGYNLVGVEYFAHADQFEEAPSLFGETFAGPMPPHSDHGERHYELHVWCWKANPNGMFAPWNPNVSCK